MSALRELWDEFTGAAHQRREGMEILRSVAEKIRHEAGEANIPGSPVSSEAIRGMHLAADLIDPEVE